MHIGNFACTYEIASGFLVDKNRQYGQVLVESDGAGSTLASYVHANDLVSIERSGVDSFYLVDGQMSTRALTDALGDITETYTYEAFGVELNISGTEHNSYRYAGEQIDSTLQKYYLRARYYTPSDGRFSARDPFIGSKASPMSLNAFLYTPSDPVNSSDPSGELSLVELVVTLAVITVAAGAALYVLTPSGRGTTLNINFNGFDVDGLILSGGTALDSSSLEDSVLQKVKQHYSSTPIKVTTTWHGKLRGSVEYSSLEWADFSDPTKFHLGDTFGTRGYVWLGTLTGRFQRVFRSSDEVATAIAYATSHEGGHTLGWLGEEVGDNLIMARPTGNTVSLLRISLLSERTFSSEVIEHFRGLGSR